MVRWRQASAVFLGGTKEALPLKGRKVRNRVALLSSSLYDRSSLEREVRCVRELCGPLGQCDRRSTPFRLFQDAWSPADNFGGHDAIERVFRHHRELADVLP